MESPRRVRIRRKKGNVVQDCDIYVGRKCTMGGWNLKQHKLHNPYPTKVYPLEESLAKYENLMRERLEDSPNPWSQLILDMSGKDLGCFCNLDKPCHIDIIIKLFNELNE